MRIAIQEVFPDYSLPPELLTDVQFDGQEFCSTFDSRYIMHHRANQKTSPHLNYIVRMLLGTETRNISL